MSLTTSGRFREAVGTGREAVQLLDEAGDFWEANMARIMVSVLTNYLGQLEEASRTAQTVLPVGYETGDFMAVACAVLFGAPTAPHCLPEGTIEAELKRERRDPLSASAVIQARGLEKLIREDDPIEAARTALWITKLYHTSRAQALRETGTLLAMQGRARQRRLADILTRAFASANRRTPPMNSRRRVCSEVVLVCSSAGKAQSRNWLTQNRKPPA